MKIYLGVPTYDWRPYWHTFNSVAFALHGAPDDWELIPRQKNSSMLGHCFNMLYTEAFNMGCDIFAMCHADIGAEPGWLTKLIHEANRVATPVIGVEIPIKDDSGRTSLAIGKVTEGYPDRPDIPRHKVMHTIRLNELESNSTFCFDTLRPFLREKGEFLCINTGLWLISLKQPWSNKVYFEIRSWTRVMDDGRMACGMLSEDWNLSRLLHILGVKPWATTKVRAQHYGVKEWDNDPRSARPQAIQCGNAEAGHGPGIDGSGQPGSTDGSVCGNPTDEGVEACQ
jgi:hypothetical protein